MRLCCPPLSSELDFAKVQTWMVLIVQTDVRDNKSSPHEDQRSLLVSPWTARSKGVDRLVLCVCILKTQEEITMKGNAVDGDRASFACGKASGALPVPDFNLMITRKDRYREVRRETAVLVTSPTASPRPELREGAVHLERSPDRLSSRCSP